MAKLFWLNANFSSVMLKDLLGVVTNLLKEMQLGPCLVKIPRFSYFL